MGVVLEFDGIDNIGGRGLPLEDGIALSSYPRHMALRALSEMKRARRNFLTDLAKDVFQQS